MFLFFFIRIKFTFRDKIWAYGIMAITRALQACNLSSILSRSTK